MRLPVTLPDRPHVSATAIEAYLACPRRVWRERYAPESQRLPRTVTRQLAVGVAVHEALERALRRRIDARRLGLPDDWDRLTDNSRRDFDRAFDACAREVADWGPASPEGERAEGWGAAGALLEAVRPLAVVAVERSFSTAIRDGWTLDGRVDAVLGDGTLVDFKTEGKAVRDPWRWSAERARTALQPGMYAAGWAAETGALPASLTFVVAPKAAGAVARSYAVRLSAGHAVVARAVAVVVSRAIEGGVFPRGSECRFCPLKSEGFC